MNNYLVYLFEFPDGKYYVGITSDIVGRFQKHKTVVNHTKISKAIMRFGWENIVKTTLYNNLTRQQALMAELFTSVMYNTKDDGYNMLAGPYGGSNHPMYGRKRESYWKGKKMSEESRKKLSQVKMGKRASAETKLKLSLMRQRGKHPNAKKVIDITTGFVFDCVGDAADAYGFGYSNLRGQLNGFNKNKTNLRYVDEVEYKND